MTLKDLLIKSALHRKGAPALQYKVSGLWPMVTYEDLLERIRWTSHMLAGIGIRPGENVVMLLENRPEWVEIYFGIVCMRMTAVPLDWKLQTREICVILNDADCVAVITSSGKRALLEELDLECPALRAVVLLDEEPEALPEPGKTTWHAYEQAREEQRQATSDPSSAFDVSTPRGDDIASIIYTSGTTGKHKGAMLSHANFHSNVDSCRQAMDGNEEDNFLLMLPLHHAFSFTTNLLFPLAIGARISFIEGLKAAAANMREVHPTILIAVPLLLEKMFDRIQKRLQQNWLTSLLCRLGLVGLLRKPIRERLGGKLRVVIVGAAATPLYILEGFAKIGIRIQEGYGLTEAGPVLSLNPHEDLRPGTVGRALPQVNLKIVHPNAEGIGEIAARGPNIMKGYYKDPEASAAVFDDSWLLTGDLGRMDDDGYLSITGRKKCVIVNREGKNIYPEEVETCICDSELIQEALVLPFQTDGEFGERVGVIVVPDRIALEIWVARNAKVLDQEALIRLMKEEVKRQALKLAEYKRPRHIEVSEQEFEKTSTAKIKRYLYQLHP